MKTITVREEPKYPLYSGELSGSCWDKDTLYEMVIITKWSDRTENAKEIFHKTFYFSPDYKYLEENIKKEDWCREIYENNIMFERFKIVRERIGEYV